MRAPWQKLTAAGVLGINARNAQFVQKYNSRHLFPRVDNKVITKALARQTGIPTPETYQVVTMTRDARMLPRRMGDIGTFVVKPARGSSGQGVIVVERSAEREYFKLGGGSLKEEELVHHLVNTLGGLYSLGGQPDHALVEYRVVSHPAIEQMSFKGVADIRIVVFLGVPVMAMLRLPTSGSQGKANLHQGAIGVGIDIETGTTHGAVSGTEIVTAHPDTRQTVVGVSIPFWPRLLEFAALSFEMTGLGYQGIDLVIDEDKGPMMLELNARPGLNIQLANQAGLLPRLQLVESNIGRLAAPDDKVAFAREHF